MTQQHPITPSPELVQQWWEEVLKDPSEPFVVGLTTRAAQWAANQELEACLRLVEIEVCDGAYELSRYIRATRRPKPNMISKPEFPSPRIIREDFLS